VNREKLAVQLIASEEFVSHAYKDSLGFWTIGYGRLIDKRKGGGITRDEARYLLEHDIEVVEVQLDRELPWWRAHDEPRQRVLADLCFNLGISGLKKFKKTLALIQSGDYDLAAKELLASEPWASQVKSRARRLAHLLRTGEAPVSKEPRNVP